MSRLDLPAERLPACCRLADDESLRGQIEATGHWKVQGSLIKSRLLYLQMKHGIPALKRILASLPEEDRAVLTKTVFVGEWYGLPLLTRLDAAIFAELGDVNQRLAEELGAFSAEVNLGGMSESLLQRDVESFLERAAVFSPTFQSFGSAHYEAGPSQGDHREAMISLRYDSAPPTRYCQSGVGYFRRAVELCGGRNVSVAIMACRREGASECRFRIRWQPGGVVGSAL